MPVWLCVALVGLVAASCTSGPAPPPITQVGTGPATSAVPTTTVVSSATVTRPTSSPGADDRGEERLAMVEDQIEARGLEDPLVLGAMTA
ncbi:MAG TPA: hypothetical protein VJ482_08860, partial [Acidimicrobiia bacterium]|nr:hypothetical protein [Acidimicrobiia bacterium]